MAAPPSSRHWHRKHPLLVVAVPASAGIILADHFSWQPGWLLVAVTLFAWLVFMFHPRLWLSLPAVFITFGLLHSFRLADTYDHPLRTALLAAPDHAMEVTVRGHLYPWTRGAEVDEAAALCKTTAVRIGSEGPFRPVTAQIKVRLPEGWALASPGLHEIKGRLFLPRAPMNPGQFDSASHGLRMGWIAHLRAQEVTMLQAASFAPRFHLLQAAENSRQWIIRQLSRGLEREGDHAAVILAMALGASDAAGEDIEDAFRDSGTLHVFAVSGLHVAMLAGIATLFLRGLGIQRITLFIILLVFAYAYITGWRPSAARAAFMTSVILAGPLFHRSSQLPNTLGAAALVLLLFDTHQLFIVGFQLSFGVLLAIMLMTSGLLETLRPWCTLDPFLPSALASPLQRLGVKLRLHIASLASVSAAAWAGSLPLMIWHFDTITPIALISNMVLVPASGICLFLSCLSLGLSTAHCVSAALLVNHANAFLAKVMVGIATWFAGLPASNHSLDLRFEQQPPPVEMQVLHLPFGGGAGYLRNGDRRWLLDTGNEDAWRYTLRPFLRHHGVNSLDGIILSHADIAHAGAAPLILKAQNVPLLHTSRLEPWPTDPPSASLRSLSRIIEPDSSLWQRHLLNEIIPLASPDGLQVTAQVLHPGPEDLHEKANDRGLVLLIQAGEFRILWLSDAGFITEKRLLERQAPVECDILIRHQHNADFSGLTELLLAAEPQAVISSNDAWRVEEALPPRLRDHCQRYQIPLFDLESSGSVGIHIHPHQALLKAHLSGQTLTLQPRLESP
ncbi:ComEC/Rec2 family competence protein [Prosthecobacter sp. SYSU 5D2]|uniref:ComEC/Rec2 family competence protein n=1 Tax=Prosthecobacter sp. SYSU 5D2 TaxID=3134134 RepID=UPI0031FEA571